MAIAFASRTLASPLFSDRFRSTPHVVWTRQAGATVLLDLERGLYYTLNDVGARIWELLVAGEPMIEILRCLEDEYEAPAHVLQEDATVLLGHLLDAKVIERIQS